MQPIERAILTALLRDMRDAGYQPAAVWDGGDHVMAETEPDKCRTYSHRTAPNRIVRAMTDDEVLAAVGSVSESTLHFTHLNADTWGNRGVLLILGNGEDFISDYHSPDGEPFSDVIEAVYERASNGLLADTRQCEASGAPAT